jgi:hypothetical protein
LPAPWDCDLLAEQVADPILGTPDNGLRVGHHDWPLKQGWSLQKKLDYRLFGREVFRLQCELLEHRILANKVADWVFEPVNNGLENFSSRLLLHVLDDVELDAELFCNQKSILRATSIAVVKDGHV